jgi:hypothetical protein
MRRSSIVPKGDDQTVYLVVDDLGQQGRVYREADVETTDLETVILDLLEGQYKNPVRVVAFTTAEKWSQDVSADVAHELRHRCDLRLRDVPFGLRDFVDRHEGRYHDVQLSLPMRLFLIMERRRKKPAAIGAKAKYPGFIEPALASSIERVPSGERWLHEIKFDGDGIAAYTAAGFQ